MSMNGPRDAQRVFEQRALANVRALVEKEQARRFDAGSAVKYTVIALGVAVAVLWGGIETSHYLFPKPAPVYALSEVSPALQPLLERYRAEVQDRIRATPPPAGLKGGAGAVTLELFVRPDGHIELIPAEVRPGSDAVRDAVALARAAAPFARVPDELAKHRSALGIRIQVDLPRRS